MKNSQRWVPFSIIALLSLLIVSCGGYTSRVSQRDRTSVIIQLRGTCHHCRYYLEYDGRSSTSIKSERPVRNKRVLRSATAREKKDQTRVSIELKRLKPATVYQYKLCISTLHSGSFICLNANGLSHPSTFSTKSQHINTPPQPNPPSSSPPPPAPEPAPTPPVGAPVPSPFPGLPITPPTICPTLPSNAPSTANSNLVSNSRLADSTQCGSPPAPASLAQVPNAPDIPASENPSGGWKLEYGDAFGSPSLQQGGEDNTYFPNTQDTCSAVDGFTVAQEMEDFTCGQVSTNAATGLTLTCSYGAPPNSVTGGPAINYNCGGVVSSDNEQPSNAYKSFSWKDPVGSGHIITVQWEWKLPPDYQFDPAIWGTGSYVNDSSGDEIDNTEDFGWNTSSWTHFTQPTLVGGEPYNYLSFNIDPAASMNTYDVVYNGENNTYQSYIDGQEISSGAISSNNPQYQDLIWSLAMRGGFSGCGNQNCSDPAAGFTSGSHSLNIRYVGYYEDSAHAGQGVEILGCPGGVYPCRGTNSPAAVVGTPPLIAPGTSIASSSQSQQDYQQQNSQLQR
jgi:hypothetical protein